MTSLNSEIVDTMITPREQNVPRKISEGNPARFTHWKTAQRPTKDQMAWAQLRPRLVPSWCGSRRIITHCWQPWGIL